MPRALATSFYSRGVYTMPVIATWAASWLETAWLDDAPATRLMQHCGGGFDIIVDLVKIDERWIFSHEAGSSPRGCGDCHCQPPRLR